MAQRDSTASTLLTATILCVVCSFIVSVAAVGLKDKQEENKILDRQINILNAAGLALGEYGKPAEELSKDQIKELYGWVSEKLVDLETGEFVTDVDPASYDPREAASVTDTSAAIDASEYDPGVTRREKIAKIYEVKRPGTENFQQLVLPVYGRGLWSTMYGYLALKSDLETIQGLTFYEHGETPGLGGEVDNPNWKAQWENKKLYVDGTPAATVAKGTAPTGSQTTVDGLSGATITSNGVTNLLKYWASGDGYGPFLSKLKESESASAGS